MALSESTLARARKLKRPAVDEVAIEFFPAVVRLAHALSDSKATANRVIRTVIMQSIRAASRWQEEADAQRWFWHHTILVVRAMSQSGIKPGNDLLVPRPDDLAYAAFIRALRGLPSQQSEAVILHLGEHLNERYLAVAMDCSTQAAVNHLRAGFEQLTAIAGDRFQMLGQQLSAAYQALTPVPEASGPAVTALLNRALLPRALRRAAYGIFTITLLIVLAVVVWQYRSWLGF